MEVNHLLSSVGRPRSTSTWSAPLLLVTIGVASRELPFVSPVTATVATGLLVAWTSALIVGSGWRSLVAALTALLVYRVLPVHHAAPVLLASAAPICLVPTVFLKPAGRRVVPSLMLAALGAGTAWVFALPAAQGVLLRMSELSLELGELPGRSSTPSLPEALAPVALSMAVWFVAMTPAGTRVVAGRLGAILLVAVMQLVHLRAEVAYLAVGALLWAWSRPRTDSVFDDPRRAPRTAAVAVASLLLCALGLRFPSAALDDDASRRVIGLLDAAFLRSDLPAADGSPAKGLRFGQWATYLRESGVDVRHLPTADEERLAGVDALVIINQPRPLTGAETLAVESFVSRGGTLMVLADHTNVLGQTRHANALLVRFGIAVRFDTAVAEGGGSEWGGALRATLHPATAGVAEPVSWGLGCSLGLRGAARPLLVASRGFSDDGDTSNVRGAMLGDLKRGPGERFGGLVLAAEARVGDGRVVVLGDTSPFQDSCFPYAYPSVSRWSRYAFEGPAGAFERAPFVGLLGLLGAVTGLVAMRRARWRDGGGTLVAASVGALLGGALGLSHDGRQPALTPTADRVIHIDRTHASESTLAPKDERSITGLTRGIARRGLLPLAAAEELVSALVRDPAGVILQGSRSELGEDELDAVDDYLRRGGHVWLFAGARGFAEAPALLRRFGIEIGDLPLGDAPDAAETSDGEIVDFQRAWPVRGDFDDSIAQAFGYPVVVRKAVGPGELVVIGDPLMFLGDGLESSDAVHPENHPFFDRLFAAVRRDP